MTKEILWLNSESTTPEDSKQLGRIFSTTTGVRDADFCLRSISSAHMVVWILLNTTNVLALDLWSFVGSLLVHW